MTRVLICGAGRVGVATAAVFSQFSDYNIYLADNRFDYSEANQLHQQDKVRTIAIDVHQTESLVEYCQANNIDVIISTLLADMNEPIIEAALSCQIHYIDCSPKVVAIDKHQKSRISSSKAAFLPNCGLAPGWTGIIANHFIQQIDASVSCQVQVGVIAEEITDSLSGSAKRFMLELTEPASIIDQGKVAQVTPLSDVWSIQIDGRMFEATHAAHGHGHLLSLWSDKVSHLSYQTLLPPGMSDKVQFLINALQLNERTDSMRKLLAPVFNRQPKGALWVRIDCQGKSQNHRKSLCFKQIIHPFSIAEYNLSSLQISTAIGIASIVDIISQNPEKYQGLIAQETMEFNSWISNRFTQLLLNKDGFYQQQDMTSSHLNTTV